MEMILERSIYENGLRIVPSHYKSNSLTYKSDASAKHSRYKSEIASRLKESLSTNPNSNVEINQNGYNFYRNTEEMNMISEFSSPIKNESSNADL